MLIVGSLLMFGIGWWACGMCSDNRRRAYKKKLEQAMTFCDTMRDTNEILVRKLQRLETMGYKEDENSLECKVDRGILNAIENIQARLVH